MPGDEGASNVRRKQAGAARRSDDARRERLAAELRANLRKRKERARALRQSGRSPDEGNGPEG